MRPLRTTLATLLATLTLAVLTPGTAHAAGIYRNDDGTMEEAEHLDESTGSLYTWIYTPPRHVHGASGAKLWIYAKASECDVAGLGQRLTLHGHELDYDPCDIWPADVFAWRSLTLPVSWLWDAANNFMTFHDLDPRGTLDAYVPPPDTGRNAYYGVDTDVASGTGLMVYLELTGTTAKYFAYPEPVRFPGTYDVGATAPDRTVTVKNVGLVATTVSSIKVEGAAAGDFAIVSNTCGRLPADSTTCTFTVRFTAGAPGSRFAAAVIRGTDAPPLAVPLHGEVTAPPPVTTITTADGTLLREGDTVSGVVTGTSSLVSETLSFDPLVPGLATVSVFPELACDAAGTACTWQAAAPLLVPGRYTVRAYGTDHQRSESPGDSIQVTVV